jgi:hypothetical protein
MKISDDKLKLFELEGDLKNYLKINGVTGNAVKEHISRWVAIKEPSTINTEKTTMVVTETDTAVETK